MKPINGYLFVSLASKFKEKNEKGIYMPVLENALVDMSTGISTYNPEEHKNIEATVVYAAEHLNNYPVRQKYRTKVGGRYSTPGEMLWSKADLGYQVEVKGGDTVFFHYLENDWEDPSKWYFDPERNEYLLILHYRWVLGYKNDEVGLRAVNGYVFVEAADEEGVVFKDGIAYRESESGILVELPSRKKKDLGRIVAHSKWEQKYQNCRLQEGSLVYVSKFGKFTNYIDGKEVWVMTQEDVMAEATYNHLTGGYTYRPVGNHLILYADKQEMKRMRGSIYIPKNQEAKDLLVSNQVAMASMAVVATGRQWGYNAEATHKRLHTAVTINDIPLKAKVSLVGDGCTLGYEWADPVKLVDVTKEFMVWLPDQELIIAKEEDVAIPYGVLENLNQ